MSADDKTRVLGVVMTEADYMDGLGDVSDEVLARTPCGLLDRIVVASYLRRSGEVAR